MKLILPIIVFITGLCLSSAAAYYSIIGLTAIFSGAFWPIIIMGTTLEMAKLVAVSWLYHYWTKTPKLIKGYLIFAILVLMLITSMGIFGFLSRAHIEQQVRITTGVSNELSIVDANIKMKQEEIADIDKQISFIDDSINKLIEKGQARSSLNAADQQKKNRSDLVKKKDSMNKELQPMRIEQIKLQSEVKKVEAEVGPIKYVAEFIYGSTDEKILDKAVRFVIIILILVFDPLAVLLLIAFNISIVKNDYDMEYFEVTMPKEKKTKNNKKEEPEKRMRPIPASIIKQEQDKIEGGNF